MADRLSAGPGNKAYGSLSVVMQRNWQVSKLKTLAPSVFLPQPQVDSVVLLLIRREPGEIEETDPIVFSELVKTGFSERRKQMRKLLGRYGDPGMIAAALRAVDLPLTARAEDVSLNQWLRMVNILSRRASMHPIRWNSWPPSIKRINLFLLLIVRRFIGRTCSTARCTFLSSTGVGNFFCRNARIERTSSRNVGIPVLLVT